MAHKGMKEFTGEELSGIALGQNGFKIIGNTSGDTEIECGVTAGYTDIQYFVALKAVDADADIEARSYIKNSDDISANSGSYNGGSNDITILNGDVIYGAFDKIWVEDTSSKGYIIAYIGRQIT